MDYRELKKNKKKLNFLRKTQKKSHFDSFENQTIRIQKLLAHSALGSRRQIEEWIKDGRIIINSKIACLGDKASSKDKLFLDGKRIRLKPETKTKVVIFHKPAGYLCSRVSEENQPSVYELLRLAKNERWVMVGRLDFNTSGLLLFTNNGELANQLMHPSSQMIRSYAVRVFPRATDEQINQLEKGIELEDGFTQFQSLKEIGDQNEESQNIWYQVEITQGKYREIRRMWQAVGLKVSRLIRIQFGPFQLPRNLSRGKYRFVEADELKSALRMIKEKTQTLKTNHKTFY